MRGQKVARRRELLRRLEVDHLPSDGRTRPRERLRLADEQVVVVPGTSPSRVMAAFTGGVGELEHLASLVEFPEVVTGLLEKLAQRRVVGRLLALEVAPARKAQKVGPMGFYDKRHPMRRHQQNQAIPPNKVLRLASFAHSIHVQSPTAQMRQPPPPYLEVGGGVKRTKTTNPRRVEVSGVGNSSRTRTAFFTHARFTTL